MLLTNKVQALFHVVYGIRPCLTGFRLNSHSPPILFKNMLGIDRMGYDLMLSVTSPCHKETFVWRSGDWLPPLIPYYNDVIMGAMASQITSLTVVYSIVYSAADQRKHQSSASLAFVRGIHRWPVNSPHKAPVTRRMFPFDDVIMALGILTWTRSVPSIREKWARFDTQRYGTFYHNISSGTGD